MKLPLIDKLSEKEQSVLKMVAVGSLAASFLVISSVWLVHLLGRDTSGETVLGDYGEMAKVYERRSDDLFEIDISAHEMAARHFTKIDQPSKAINHLLRILPAQPDNKRLRCDLATAYLKSKQYGNAQRLFEELKRETEDSLSAVVAARHGLTLFYRGHIEESLKQLRKSQKKHPESSEIYCYLGQIEASINIPSPAAEAHFEKAIELDPTYVEARYQQARYFMKRDDYLQCRDSLLAILKIEPLHVRTHSRLGMVYYYLNQPEMAEKSYLTALALNPGDFNTHYNLGELLYTFRDNPRAALQQFREAAALAPGHPEANFKIGLICLNSDLLKEAALHLQRAADAAPDNIRMLLQLGVAYERLGSKQRALETYQRIRAISPLNRIANQKIASLQNQIQG